MAGLTTPTAAAPRSAMRALAATATTPMMAAGYAMPGNEALPAVASGIATQFWTELVAYPGGSARSLWLLVDGVWKRYDNSPGHWEDMVQRAFTAGQVVRVWHDGEAIVGLVVSG